MAVPVNQAENQAIAFVAYKTGVDTLTQAAGTGNGMPAPLNPTGGTPVNQTNAQSQNVVSSLNASQFAG